MHEAKASERADSGPPVATPLVFAVLAALFLTYQLIPIERIARLVKGGSGLAESGGGPRAGGAKRFSYPTPPAFPSTRTTDYIYFFHCLRWNNVVVCDSCRRVVPPPPAVSGEHARYIRRITAGDASAHTARRSGAVAACVDGGAESKTSRQPNIGTEASYITVGES